MKSKTRIVKTRSSDNLEDVMKDARTILAHYERIGWGLADAEVHNGTIYNYYMKLKFEKAERKPKQREDFFKLCNEHIDHAIEKHPEFVEILDDNPGFDFESHKSCAERLKNFSRRRATTLSNVLFSEVHEFLHEVEKGNVKRAKEEAADVVAVLFRAFDWMKQKRR